jgi:cytoskeletal protein CcmA (bactofilin family)
MAQGKSRSGGASSEARVGSTTRIRGRVSGDGNLLVEGRVEGSVAVSGAIRVAAGGVVEGDVIEADTLEVAGSVDGELRVSGQVHASAGSRVRGHVIGGTLALDDGAQFEGRIDNDFSLPPELEAGTERPRRR